MSFELYSMAVNLAMKAPWRDWDESVPDETEVCIDDVMLRESGDERICALLDLMEQTDQLSV